MTHKRVCVEFRSNWTWNTAQVPLLVKCDFSVVDTRVFIRENLREVVETDDGTTETKFLS